MQPVTIYSSPFCGFCDAAKRLLKGKGIDFEEIDVAMNPDKREEMLARANGRHTVPQIFIGETHIGGYDDLSALDRADKLSALLAG